MKINEKIICAAVWYKDLELKKEMPECCYLPKNIQEGIVFCGYRHAQCIYTKVSITGLRDAESGENEQGFLTSHNRFVSREEALTIALKENQVIDLSQVTGDRLFSEDLY
jgi:hypothetical protein